MDNRPPPDSSLFKTCPRTDEEHPVDFLIGNRGLETDMAFVFHQLFPKKYQYYGNDVWRMYDETSKRWIVETKQSLLNHILTIYSGLLLERAFYWESVSCKSKNPIEQHDASMKSHHLLLIHIRWMNKHTSYSKNILNELKLFYLVKELES